MEWLVYSRAISSRVSFNGTLPRERDVRLALAAGADLLWFVPGPIVAISSIHLLRVFMDARNIETQYLMWYVIIHMTFVVSAVLMGVLDKLTKH